jgi:hypothetical protein
MGNISPDYRITNLSTIFRPRSPRGSLINMKIAFTTCTNSWVPFARVVAKTLLKHNPDYTYFICITDKPEPDMAPYYEGYDIVPCDQIGIGDAELNDMVLRYGINIKNVLKPFYLEYFFKKYPQAEHIFFIDPDMVIYDKLTTIEEMHKTSDILLFPHLLRPQSFDGKTPNEISYLSTGTYNLGLISIKINDNTFRFIEWWRERLREYCYFDWKAGLFSDQKWINLAPVFFDKVANVMHPGYNIGYWNLHERKVTRENGKLLVNGTYPLVIYHFSNINIPNKRLFDTQQDRYTEADFPLLMELFEEYRQASFAEGYEKTIKKPCYYAKVYEDYHRAESRKTVKGRIKLWAKSNLSKSFRAKLKKSLAGFLEG